MTELLAVGFAVLGALGLSGRNILVRLGLTRSDPITGIFIALIISLPLNLGLVLALEDLARPLNLDPLTLLYLAGAGLFHLIIGRSFAYSSFKIMGPSRASPIIENNMVLSTLLAILLLGERITPLLIMGTAIASLGVMIISRSGMPGTSPAAIDRSKVIRGTLRALMAASIWGITPLIIRVGVIRTGSPTVANLISVSFALLIISLGMAISRGTAFLGRADAKTLYTLVGAGIFQSLAQLSRYWALGLGPVVVVAPFASTNGIFTLILGALLIPKLEQINRKVVAGTLLVLLGVLLVLLAIQEL